MDAIVSGRVKPGYDEFAHAALADYDLVPWDAGQSPCHPPCGPPLTRGECLPFKGRVPCLQRETIAPSKEERRAFKGRVSLLAREERRALPCAAPAPYRVLFPHLAGCAPCTLPCAAPAPYKVRH
ncbi:MAG: hypothetical protein MdMp014T_1179 [Treponematales bacterium]